MPARRSSSSSSRPTSLPPSAATVASAPSAAAAAVVPPGAARAVAVAATVVPRAAVPAAVRAVVAPVAVPVVAAPAPLPSTSPTTVRSRLWAPKSVHMRTRYVSHCTAHTFLRSVLVLFLRERWAVDKTIKTGRQKQEAGVPSSQLPTLLLLASPVSCLHPKIQHTHILSILCIACPG